MNETEGAVLVGLRGRGNCQEKSRGWAYSLQIGYYKRNNKNNTKS